MRIFKTEITTATCNQNLKMGECMYDGNCRKKMVVYNLKCLIILKSYGGKTQRAMHTQTTGHIDNIWKCIESGRKKFWAELA